MSFFGHILCSLLHNINIKFMHIQSISKACKVSLKIKALTYKMVPNKAKTKLFNTYNQTLEIINIFLQLIMLMDKRKNSFFAKRSSGNEQALL